MGTLALRHTHTQTQHPYRLQYSYSQPPSSSSLFLYALPHSLITPLAFPIYTKIPTSRRYSSSRHSGHHHQSLPRHQSFQSALFLSSSAWREAPGHGVHGALDNDTMMISNLAIFPAFVSLSFPVACFQWSWLEGCVMVFFFTVFPFGFPLFSKMVATGRDDFHLSCTLEIEIPGHADG